MQGDLLGHICRKQAWKWLLWEGCAAEATPRAWLLERAAGHPTVGKEEPPISIEGARAMFTGKYTAEDAQACKKLGGFRAGKLHRCLSASRPRGGLSCVVLCSALQLLLESSAPSSTDVHTACRPRTASGRSKELKRCGKRGFSFPAMFGWSSSSNSLWLLQPARPATLSETAGQGSLAPTTPSLDPFCWIHELAASSPQQTGAWQTGDGRGFFVEDLSDLWKEENEWP